MCGVAESMVPAAVPGVAIEKSDKEEYYGEVGFNIQGATK